jgi:hypothetical protein
MNPATATIAAAKVLPKSRDVSKEGPLKGYLDNASAYFGNDPAKQNPDDWCDRKKA